MTKLNKYDIKIKGYGEILKDKINKRGLDLKEFVKLDNGKEWTSVSTVKKYFKSGGSKVFRYQAAARLGLNIQDLEKSPEDQVREYVHRFRFKPHDFVYSKEIIDRIRELCKKYNLKIEDAMMKRELGVYYVKNGETNIGDVLISDAVKELERLNYDNHSILFNYRLDLASIKQSLGLYSDAISIYKKLRPYLKHDIPTRFLWRYYYNYSVVLNENGETDKAIKLISIVLDYCNDPLKTIKVCNNLALYYKKQNSLLKSLDYLNKAIKIAKLNDIKDTCAIYNNLAEVYVEINRLDEAMDSINKCLEIADKDNPRLIIYKTTELHIKKLNNKKYDIKEITDEISLALKKEVDYIKIIESISDMVSILIDDKENLGVLKSNVEQWIDIYRQSDFHTNFIEELYRIYGKINYECKL